jgi:hypothetical protein
VHEAMLRAMTSHPLKRQPLVQQGASSASAPGSMKSNASAVAICGTGRCHKRLLLHLRLRNRKIANTNKLLDGAQVSSLFTLSRHNNSA